MGVSGRWSVVPVGSVAVLLAFATACQDGGPVGPSPVAAADAVMAANAGRPVPFRAEYIITPVLLVPGEYGYPNRCATGPANAATRATGEGHATHLGQITETESNCVDFSTLLLTLGEFTFTSANGDRVWGEFEGSASADPAPPNADLSCTWRITGGTGRFAGARGDGECVDSQQLGDGRSLIRFEGRIRYAASARRHGPAGMWPLVRRSRGAH